MKKTLCVTLCLMVLISIGALSFTVAAVGSLPAAMTDVEGLDGYKAFIYQDFSASGLSLWVSDTNNTYSIADGKLTLTNWGAWTKGKVEQAGSEISSEVLAASEGYGFYVKGNSVGMWVKPTYYVASSNELLVPVETPYVLIPLDGSEPTEAVSLQYGQFLVPANFEGYILIEKPLSELEGFSPYAAVEGNLNVTSNDTAAVFDNFLLWATAPESENTEAPAETEAPNGTEAPTQTGDISLLFTTLAGITALGSLAVFKVKKHFD